MSQYLKIKTEMKDPALVAQALAMAAEEHGFEWERHEQAVALRGYRGRTRQEKAEFIIRKRWVGRSSNDLGWSIQPDGTVQAIVSEFDQRQPRSMGIVKSVNDAYTIANATRIAQVAGYTVTPVKNGNGKVVELSLTKY